MSAGRILGLLLAVAVVAWLVRSQGILGRGAPEAGVAAPADRARAAARASGARGAQTEAASRALDSQAAGEGGGGSVSEDMTPEQVRALIGPPDSVDSQTGEDGIVRERWTYRRVGKTVVFENGVVARVE